MTRHLKEMITDRIQVLPVDDNYLVKLYQHILNLDMEGDFRVCIDRLHPNIIQKDPRHHRREKNEIWVVVNKGIPTTLYRRRQKTE